MPLLECQVDRRQVAQEEGISEIQSETIPILSDNVELGNKWDMPSGGIVI
jgi:hypothetical protein